MIRGLLNGVLNLPRPRPCWSHFHHRFGFSLYVFGCGCSYVCLSEGESVHVFKCVHMCAYMHLFIHVDMILSIRLFVLTNSVNWAKKIILIPESFGRPPSPNTPSESRIAELIIAHTAREEIWKVRREGRRWRE